jgi:protein SCO1/2
MRIGSLWLIIAGVMLLTACSTTTSTSQPLTDQLRGAVLTPPRVLADFSLMSTTGETFTLSEHHGQIILLYFGYRTCPDICPTTFATMKRVYQELGEPVDKLKVVFVTVDPERDNLADMALYTAAFHKDFIGLRDDGEALKQIMSAFGVIATRRKVGESALSYLIDHTASVFMIGPDGKLLAQYLYGTDYRDFVHDLKLLMAEI